MSSISPKFYILLVHVIYNDVINVQSAVFKLLPENRFESSAFFIFPIHTYMWVKLGVKSDVRAAFRKVLNLNHRSRQRIFVYVYIYHSTSNRPLHALDDRCSLKIKIYCSLSKIERGLRHHFCRFLICLLNTPYTSLMYRA